jgi:thiosulfate/3-mercaptopyruvate sulfurtransferase
MMGSDFRAVHHAEIGTMTHPLIDAPTLARDIDVVLLFDSRWKLGEPNHGRDVYLAGHIPGAIRVDLDTDLSAPPGISGRHPLPTPEAFRGTLERLGVSRDTTVVVYDDSAGTVAARMWWMLRSIGHQNVSVLDGGIQSWIDAGGALESGQNKPSIAEYLGPLSLAGTVDIDDLSGRTVVDVRAPERYRGDHEPVDPRPGHIPGAINIPVTDSLVDGRFGDVHHLMALYRELEDPVMSCGSGVNACHSALAMVAAGLEMPEIYIGSYSEWSRSDRPVVIGPDPE